MFFVFIAGTLGITFGQLEKQNLQMIFTLLVEELQDSKMV